MALTLNKEAYTRLVEEDLAWLLTQPRTLERDHIVSILKESIESFYPKKGYIPPGLRGDRA